MKHPLKIINLGLPRSGTTTLADALKATGFQVADWRVDTDIPDSDGFVADLMYKGYFETGDPLALMPDYNAFTEISIVRNSKNIWPQMDYALIAAITKYNPGTKFLLSHRNPAKLSDSMHRWSNLGKHRLPINDVPGMPAGYGGNDPEHIRWIEGHYAFCRRIFDGADNFLEYDLEDDQAPVHIGKFIGKELDWWGKSNDHAYRVEKAKRAQERLQD